MTVLKEKKVALKPSNIAEDAVQSALKKVNDLDFPNRRTEDWRYAKLGKILNREWSNPVKTAVDIQGLAISDLDAYRVVFVNGVFDEAQSSLPQEEGVTCQLLSVAKGKLSEHYNKLTGESDEIFTALNTAYSTDGMYLEVEKNKVISKPIYLINICTGSQMIAHVRNLIVAQSGAEVKVIQGYYGVASKEVFSNAITEVFVSANAKVEIDKVQKLGAEDRQVCTEEVYQEKDSTFKINTFQLGGEFLRNGINVRVDGTNCHTEMNGYFSGRNKQYLDNHTKVDHLKSNCTSSELYKGILRDSSTGVFNGKVIVHQDAQVIEAYQQNDNVVLSDSAVMNTKPELEIYADDVRCSHGTTTGQFDEQAIFYLQARGISKEMAKEMLVAAFAEEVLEKVRSEEVVDFIKSQM